MNPRRMVLKNELLPKLSPLTSGDEVNDVDLTLRLGLPFYDSQKHHDEKANLPRQDEKLDALQVQGGSSTTPHLIHDNTPPPMPGSQDDVGRSRESTPKVCTDCGVDSTPLWRKGPEGAQTLCNACGLRYARLMRRS